MPEDRTCKKLQPSRSTDQKKKKKKKKRNTATPSTCAPQNAEKALDVSLPPEILLLSLLPPHNLSQSQGQLPKHRASSKKKGELLTGLKSEKHHKDSPAMPTASLKTSGSGDPKHEYMPELSIQAGESLRWEGVLQDPQAEAERLEQYRANRRQRYIAHREALLKENQDASRQSSPNDSKEETDPTKSDQRETASLLQLNSD